ncbi:MAG: hypothetical protein A3F68_00205 [Acidobacteria bacterium RIFCSPLOWO2_12_FULL_54_10]|nr:MAG: hypothetical protein A3F68_00205 [Acidobacteria bacterium RIFCSPLOWO2_12_FULL_54_10]
MGNAALTPEQERKVLESAMQLASTRELGDISVDQLARACGISAFNIVRHYHSKEKILEAVLQRELQLIAGAVPSPELRFPTETLRDELQVLAKVILLEYRQRLPFLGKLLGEAMRNPAVGEILYRTFVQQGRLLFTEFLKLRKERGELRKEVDIEAAAAMFLAALTGILLVVEVFGGKQVEKLDDERLVRELTNVFLHGVTEP